MKAEGVYRGVPPGVRTWSPFEEGILHAWMGGGWVPVHWVGVGMHSKRPQKQLDRRLEEVATAVTVGYCGFQKPLKLVLADRGTVAGHRQGALEG